jgi:hypothetical protein
MTHGRSLITTIFLAATILLISSRTSRAQDQTPPPRMLLNLDLFTAPPDSKKPGQAPGGGESTLQQLRALRSMGYLSADGPLPDDDANEPVGTPSQPAAQGQQVQQ